MKSRAFRSQHLTKQNESFTCARSSWRRAAYRGSVWPIYSTSEKELARDNNGSTDRVDNAHLAVRADGRIVAAFARPSPASVPAAIAGIVVPGVLVPMRTGRCRNRNTAPGRRGGVVRSETRSWGWHGSGALLCADERLVPSNAIRAREQGNIAICKQSGAHRPYPSPL
jgi:hypothetical protein